MRPLLGTFVEVAISAPSTRVRAAFDGAFAAIEAIQRCLSFHDPDSELSRLNRSAGQAITLGPASIRVLRAGRALSLASNGLFNYTVAGALVRLGVLPDHGGGPLIDCGSFQDVEIRGREVRLTRPVRITLDGIAKGYALDCAARALRRNGVRAGWINAGGDIRVFGPLTLPVTRRERDGVLRALGGLREASIATSVVHDQRQERSRFPGEILATDGTRPDAGTWTVLAHHAWKADALTKVAALAPAKERAELIRRLGGTLVEPMEALH